MFDTAQMLMLLISITVNPGISMPRQDTKRPIRAVKVNKNEIIICVSLVIIVSF